MKLFENLPSLSPSNRTPTTRFRVSLGCFGSIAEEECVRTNSEVRLERGEDTVFEKEETHNIQIKVKIEEDTEVTDGKHTGNAGNGYITGTDGEGTKVIGDEVDEVIDSMLDKEISINENEYNDFKEQEGNDITGLEKESLWDEFMIVFIRLGMEIDATIDTLQN